jgi:hypothetical protein
LPRRGGGRGHVPPNAVRPPEAPPREPGGPIPRSTPRPIGTPWAPPITAPATRAAVAALEQAGALAGGTAFDDVFLAMAYARMGDPEGTRQALARALLRAERDHQGHPELAAFCERPTP